ncbi:MAG: serine--tRNA ligase [Candidatus Marinimicrobia bacterium]|jgi:seryl-tRNA synthetase|nr:serine--tRNA ligase [Candidatus Neomarinimicrobiota bacterium]MBT3676266.1 serine--tRNA ligase [Candidatus Neomarinimicrobiota bacterium]MBT3763149.1 serine--tRNA ligase [Candidatus Neomarinimicrobiota bacterium]MBT4068931.1 serine--tRNA ligase [Candidatus Neomarinimicrobiota bacterium]MBT4270824.1 serine--tRNA ligase [Candidatus Neomarinimicrobiota bacterium]
MIPIEHIRNNPEEVAQKLTSKGENPAIEGILKLDEKYRTDLGQANDLRAKRNKASDAIAKAKRSGENADDAINSMREVSQHIKVLEEKTQESKTKLDELLLGLPNLPHESVPAGKDEKDNPLVREWGESTEYDFELKNHLELGEALGLFDFERGAKIAGSGFPLYTGRGAKLERALINYMLDVQTDQHGYTEIFPPFLVRSESAITTGQLPKFSEDMYFSEKDGLWLIPTAEVPLTNIHKDEILNEDQLSINYAAYSACFRREAGSYGKDTRGFLRLHQFNKVELVKLVKPENSYEELEKLVIHAEYILQSLGLKYRVIELCTGDLSFSAAKCYDLELWAPGERKWLEVSSCSNFEDFQARRGNIRYRKANYKKVEFVHTLNGSGVATPRLLVALLETYQKEDGSIDIPKPLQSYLGAEVLD